MTLHDTLGSEPLVALGTGQEVWMGRGAAGKGVSQGGQWGGVELAHTGCCPGGLRAWGAQLLSVLGPQQFDSGPPVPNGSNPLCACAVF